MRPLAKTGLVFFCCFVAASFFRVQIQIVACCAFLGVAFFFAFLLRKRAAAAVLVLAGLAFGYMGLYTQLVYEPAHQFSGKTAQITGTIVEMSPSQGGLFYQLRVAGIDGEKVVPFQVSLYSEIDLGADYYDTLTVQAKLRSSSPPGSALQLGDRQKPKGTFLSASPVDGSEIVCASPSARPPHLVFLHLRDGMIEAIDRCVGEPQSGLVQGLLFGRKDGIEFSTSQDFRRAGLAHALAVSGLHLTILSQALLLLFYLCRIPRKAARLITILFVLGFMAMAGFTPSVVRAGITTTIYLAAAFFGRESDGLNSLGGAAVVILLLNPFAVADVSFLLSFSATLGILLVSSKITAFGKRFCMGVKLLEGVCENFSVSLAAVLFTAPVSMLAFQEFSVIAPVSNLVACLMFAPLLVAGFLTGVLGMVWQGAGELLGRITRSLAWMLSKIAEFFASFPYSHLPLGFGFVKAWVFCAAGLIGLSMLSRSRRRMVRYSALLSVIVLLGGILSHQVFFRDVICVAVVGNGFGYSIVVTYDSRATVIDCGGGDYSGRNTYNYLSSKGIEQIDSLILTGLDREAAGGAAFLVSQCSVRSLVMPDKGPALGEIQHEAERAGIKTERLDGMQITLSSYCRAEIDNRFKQPAVILRFPHVAFGYSPNAGSLYEAVKNDNVNILLTKDEINTSLKNLPGRYAIILNDIPTGSDSGQPENLLYAPPDQTTELMVGMGGIIVERGDG